MNDKIKELIKSLGIIPEDEHYEIAELIVKECVQTLSKRYMGDNNREDMEVRRCIEDVKKHFGVK